MASIFNLEYSLYDSLIPLCTGVEGFAHFGGSITGTAVTSGVALQEKEGRWEGERKNENKGILNDACP